MNERDAMDMAVRKHFGRRVTERARLTGGYSFKTWRLTLDDGRKLVLRTAPDTATGSGRPLIMAEIFERERFFYDCVNEALGHICPTVYVIDDAREHMDSAYQISEYMEGTPLHLRMEGFDERERRAVLRRIGEIAAGIGNIEIDAAHPYMTARGPWEAFMAGRLRERLMPLEKNGLITRAEAERIADGMRSGKACATAAFLHLDLRFINMIYNNGGICVLDAENCEFGDPLFDLAVIEMNGCLTPSFMEGYMSVTRHNTSVDDDLFYYYKMERLALVLNVFINDARDAQAARPFLDSF